MRTVDLSDYDIDQTTDELAFEEGQFVEHEEHGAGLIGARLDESVDFPDPDDPEDETIEIEGTADDPVFMVALLDGGSTPAKANELEAIDDLPGEGEDPESGDDIDAIADEVELSPVYDMVDDPQNEDQIEEAKRKYMHTEYAGEIGEWMDENGVGVDEMRDMSADELEANLAPRIDRAGTIGFKRLPEGWNRKSVLKAWNTLRRKWRTCRARMLRHFGNELAKRWCAVLKDEVYRTTRWRNRW